MTYKALFGYKEQVKAIDPIAKEDLESLASKGLRKLTTKIIQAEYIRLDCFLHIIS